MIEQKRTRTRVDYSAHALIRSGTTGTTKGIVRDISIDSIYLTCQCAFEIDDTVNLEIILLGRESELIIKVSAKVVRKDKGGVAMRFIGPLEWWPIFAQFPLHKLDKKKD